jgi:large repetitive protein
MQSRWLLLNQKDVESKAFYILLIVKVSIIYKKGVCTIMRFLLMCIIIISFSLFFISCYFENPNGTPEPTEAPTPMPTAYFGSGSEGELNVAERTEAVNSIVTTLVGEHEAGRSYIEVTSVTGISAGDEVFMYNSQGPGAGEYEFAEVTAVHTFTLDVSTPLTNTYPEEATVFVYRVPHYTDVIVGNDGIITAQTWDPSSGGGVVVFRASGSISVIGTGRIDVSGMGYRGPDRQIDDDPGIQGEGYPGIGIQSVEPNGNGGGGGGGGYLYGGGGGGHANPGGNGSPQPVEPPVLYGLGGYAVGNPELTQLFFGGAGGTGDDNDGNVSENPNGGSGGGIIYIAAPVLTIKNVLANGTAGKHGGNSSSDTEQDGGAGGGAGGSIYLIGNSVTITGDVTAIGGVGRIPEDAPDSKGGDGSMGRIRIKAAAIDGVTVPAAYTGE